MCQHRYEYQGRRTYGDNIPGYAQGAFFPDDTPGARCRLTGETCDNPAGDCPATCAVKKLTDWLCPDCQREGDDRLIWSTGCASKYFCPSCDGEWTEAELPQAFTELLSVMAGDRDAALNSCEQAKKDNSALRATLERIRKTVEGAV